MALIAIPVLVHFFARSKPPAFKFSDITFLQRILKKTARIRKPQDWLTLVLRTLAVAALLFAFLHPLLISKDPNSTPGADKNIVFVIDQSASMDAHEGSDTRFSKACVEVAQMIRELKPDNANIVWLKAKPSTAFPAPSPNIAYLNNLLQQNEARHETGSISGALRMAVEQLQQIEGNREIILISDFQSSAWKDAELPVPDSIKFTKIKVGESPIENLAITSLIADPPSPVSGQNTLITARINNFSDKAKHSTIYLNAGGSRQSKEIEIPAWSQTETAFTSSFRAHGNVQVTASLSEDTFPADDERHLIIPVRETLRLVSSTKSPSDASRILERCASALPWLSHDTTNKLPSPRSCDILFLHDWDGTQLEAIEKLSSEGMTIIAEPGLKCPPAVSSTFLSLPQPSSNIDYKKNEQGWSAQIASESSPVFALFRSGEFGNPVKGSFRSRMELPQSWLNASGITTLISYTDQTPAILKKNGDAAQRLLWNLPISPDSSDWSQQDPFLPFVAELLLQIQPTTTANHFESIPGSPLSWVLPENITADSVSLLPPAGEAWAVELKNTDKGTLLISKQDMEPGIFEWKTGSTTTHTSFANFPQTESDLRQIDPADLSQGEAAETSSLLREDALNQGLPLWPWLAAAALLFLLGESIAATPPKPKTSAS
ncbi:N-terminal double-transmembrane domain-containing protein [Rubritalea squalenifaciens DSM 18772]|uniref:N-terminal double-transmembrane domain-containing protein n=2 Tax=Rubritalea squalenifaciens TaxID=407226 RepID=A0A1M6EP87_9BACT|nr:N-terminal double-transmembrane domain-containing protein [Rubritalea squalenifaciens DSM 18772]